MAFVQYKVVQNMRFAAFCVSMIISQIVSLGADRYSLPLVFEPNLGQTDSSVRFVARSRGFPVLLEDCALAPLKSGGARLRFVNARCREIEGADPTGGVSNYVSGRDPAKWITRVPHYRSVRYRDVWPGIDVIFHGSPTDLEYDFIVRPGGEPRRIQLRWDGAKGIHLEGADVIVQTAGGDLRMHRPRVYQDLAGGRVEIDTAYKIEGRTVGFAMARYDAKHPVVIDPVLSYSTYLGSPADEFSRRGAVDGTGSIFVAQTTVSTVFPTTPGALDSSANGSDDVVVSRFKPDGTGLLYSTYIGGSGRDSLSGIAVDRDGNAYVAGSTASPNFPTTPSALKSALGGTRDAFVLKLNPTGTQLLYSTLLGGPGDDVSQGIAIDGSGNAYLLANASTGYPTTPGAYRSTGGSGYHVSKLNATGSALVYSAYLGNPAMTGFGCAGFSDDDIAVDSAGNAVVAGCTESSSFPPTTAGAFDTSFNGREDAFVLKLNASGSALVFSTFLGGDSSDWVGGVAVDADGNIFVSGTTSSNFPATTRALASARTRNQGGVYVAKFDPNGRLIYCSMVAGSDVDYGDAMSVDPSGNVLIAGGTTSGNFPVTQGAVATTKKGGQDAYFARLGPNGDTLDYSTYLGGAGTDEAYSVVADNSGNVYVVGWTSSSDFVITPGAYSTNNQGGIDTFITKISGFSTTTRITRAVNGASFASSLAPGSWLTLNGTGLGGSGITRIWGNSDFSGNRMPTSLDGVSVQVAGRSAAVYYISPTQINALIPPNVPPGGVEIVVQTPNGSSTISTSLQQYAPALFQFDPQERRYAAAVHPDGTFAGPAGLFGSGVVVSPVSSGARLLLFGTGFGETSPAAPVGEVFPVPLSLASPAAVTITVGGRRAVVEFAGLVSPGLYQFNIVIPDGLTAGDQQVITEIGGVRSPDGVMLSVNR